MPYSAKGRTKNFPVFDCDSHIYEPPEVWDKYIPENHRDFARTHFYRDADRLISVKNGKISFRDPNKWKYPGETWHPGLNKQIIGAVSPGTKEWDEQIGRNRSARDPLARLKDMDAAGIDQVMIFPSRSSICRWWKTPRRRISAPAPITIGSMTIAARISIGSTLPRCCLFKTAILPSKSCGASPGAASNRRSFG